ncbi:MAG TPA: HNH endonuclease [Pirellulaceae bacterium]|nr:HNH endonuclease [Pirellulaceae bacterium]
MYASALEHPTLVLNRNWTVVNVVPVRRALILVCRNAARIIAPETYETHDLSSWAAQAIGADESSIRLVSRAIRVPEAIVLVTYERPPQQHVPFTRRNLYRRDANTCQYCGRRPGTEELSIDHVVPRSMGGRSSWTNCVLACVRCNIRKGSRTPQESAMRLLRKPFKPRWMPQITLPPGLVKRSWPQFISDRYWEVELTD